MLDAFIAANRETIIARSRTRINKSAGQYGRDLLGLGLTVRQVVHGYGDVCQTVTVLAVEKKESIAPEELKTLNLCLDDATAAAVSFLDDKHLDVTVVHCPKGTLNHLEIAITETTGKAGMSERHFLLSDTSLRSKVNGNDIATRK